MNKSEMPYHDEIKCVNCDAEVHSVEIETHFIMLDEVTYVSYVCLACGPFEYMSTTSDVLPYIEECMKSLDFDIDISIKPELRLPEINPLEDLEDE